jgi:penicillin-insensitive murein endopeptidase
VSARAEAIACCPACAASARRSALRVVHGAKGRRALPGLRRWAWAGVLLALAALVPLAALGHPGERAVAIAPPGAITIPPAPPPPPPVARATEESVSAQVAWHPSLALGSPNAGRLVDGVLLPVRGTGYYTYNPDTQEPPGGPLRRWATAATIRHVLAIASWWAAAHPDAPRLGIGDLSLRDGGPFTSDHASHQNGLDVDIRLPRRDGVEGPATPSDYDRALAQDLVDHAIAEGAGMVLIGPSLDLHGPAGIVLRWPNHDDHLHLRFPDPDGTGN